MRPQQLPPALAAVVGAAWAFGFVAGAAVRRVPLERVLQAPPVVPCLTAVACMAAAGAASRAFFRRRLAVRQGTPAQGPTASALGPSQVRSAQAGHRGATPSAGAMAPSLGAAVSAVGGGIVPAARAGARHGVGADAALQARMRRRQLAPGHEPHRTSKSSGPTPAPWAGRGESALPQATDALLRVLVQVLAPCRAALLELGPQASSLVRAAHCSPQEAAAVAAPATTPPQAPPPAWAEQLARRVGPEAWAQAQAIAGRGCLLWPQGEAALAATGGGGDAVPPAPGPLRLALVADAARQAGQGTAPLWGLLAVERAAGSWSVADATLLEGVAGQLALAWNLEQALRQSRRHLQRLERIATTDGLTELVNQRHFAKLFDLQLARARRYNRRLSLIFLDIDHFKAVNDTHGHQMGDEVLKKVAQVLRNTARCTDTVARLGGEEFAVLMEETGAKGAERYAERIRQKLSRETFVAGARSFRKTCSLGVATFPEHGEDAKDLMAHADQALYFAKRTGRNRTVIYRADATTRESLS